MGIPVEMLRIDVKGEQATVNGKVQSQADREKIVLTVGNTNGIAKVDDRLELVAKKEAPKKEPEAKYYTVVKGDSLSKIAKAQYGDAMKYPTIFEANKPMLKDPDKIYPGQVLRIPPLAP
jgi:nucleoid-associated protein YgaU